MLDDWKKSSFLFFWYPPRTQIVTFWWSRKGCDYLGKCDYLEVQYLILIRYQPFLSVIFMFINYINFILKREDVSLLWFILISAIMVSIFFWKMLLNFENTCTARILDECNWWAWSVSHCCRCSCKFNSLCKSWQRYIV